MDVNWSNLFSEETFTRTKATPGTSPQTVILVFNGGYNARSSTAKQTKKRVAFPKVVDPFVGARCAFDDGVSGRP